MGIQNCFFQDDFDQYYLILKKKIISTYYKLYLKYLTVFEFNCIFYNEYD